MMNFFLIIVFVLSMAGCGASDPTAVGVHKVVVKDAQLIGAVCNDGSPAAYYFRKGAQSNLWVISVQGGKRCSSVAECVQKMHDSVNGTSSSWWEIQRPFLGVLSDNPSINPDFYQANQVYMRQCSSDGWLGNRDASAATSDIAFKGDTIFRAIIRDLQDGLEGVSLNQANSILLSGSSSGGHGVMHHLDWFKGLFPQAYVCGVFDAGFYLDQPAHDPSFDSPVVLGNKYQSLYSPVYDVDCQSAFPTNIARCSLPEAAYAYVTTPLMIRQAQSDRILLSMYGVVEPYDASERAFIAQYVIALKQALAPLPLVFANRGFVHGVMAHEGFNNTYIHSMKLSQFLGDWYFQRTGLTHLVY